MSTWPEVRSERSAVESNRSTSTKKITRAMELIAATRVVKAQERAQAARPYAEEITSVILDLVKAGAAKDHPLLRENPDATTACLAGDHVRPRAVRRATTARSSASPSGRSRSGRRAASEYSLVVVGGKALSYFKFRDYRDRRRRSPASPTSPPTSRPARSPRRSAAATKPASWPASTSSTPGSSRSARRRP